MHEDQLNRGGWIFHEHPWNAESWERPRERGREGNQGVMVGHHHHTTAYDAFTHRYMCCNPLQTMRFRALCDARHAAAARQHL